MGKKRAREADGKDAPPPDSTVDKMDEDSGSEEVSFRRKHNDFAWLNGSGL